MVRAARPASLLHPLGEDVHEIAFGEECKTCTVLFGPIRARSVILAIFA